MIVLENRFKKIFKKLGVLMLCFTFVLSCFAIPQFECATLEDNIYFEFKDDPFAPSIEAVNGTNSIEFYTGTNFDTACGSIIIDLNAGSIRYGLMGTGESILAFNQGSWVDNAYAKIIQTHNFTPGNTSQNISDALYTWLYDAASVLTLYEFISNYTFRLNLQPFNSLSNIEWFEMFINDINGNDTILYQGNYYHTITFYFHYSTLHSIQLSSNNDDIFIYENYIWVNSRNIEFTIPNDIEINGDYEQEFYLWFIQNTQLQSNSVYDSIGGFYNIISNVSFSFENYNYNLSGTYNNLPFNRINIREDALYVEMVVNNEIVSSYLVEQNVPLYLNYQNIPKILKNELLNNGVFTSTIQNNNDNSVFSNFIQLIYTFIDIPLYYIRNILNINILSISLQTIVYSLLSVGILLWLIRQVVGINSLGGK